MGEGFWLGEVRRRDDFAGFSLPGLRVLFLLADGRARSGDDLAFYAREQGITLSYQQARLGCRMLLDKLWPSWKYRAYGEWHRDDIPGAMAFERVVGARSHCQLTPLGLELAGKIKAIVGDQGVDWMVAGGAKDLTPPDPVTPLWEVYTEATKVLAVAADAQAAMALVEREIEGAIATRATAVPTDAPLILVQWESL